MSTLINRLGGVGKRGPNYATIDNAALFDGSTGYLSWTPAGDGGDTWTLCARIKLWNLLAADGPILEAGGQKIEFNASEQFQIRDTADRNSTAVFRDPTAWGTLVVSCNAGTPTATWNGATISLSATPTLTAFNSVVLHRIGYDGTSYAPVYLADVVFVSGSALDGSLGGDFLTATGAPKAYTGPYGTNGFHLKFNNAANLGEDSSGNGNNWTVNGTITQVTDTPTNNVAVLNATTTKGTVSEGGRRFSAGTLSNMAFSTFMVSSGKWYVESESLSGFGAHHGWISSNEAQEKFLSNVMHHTVTNSIYWQDAQNYLVVRENGVNTFYSGEINNGSTAGLNYTIGLALDLDANTVQVVNSHGIQPARSIPAGRAWTWVAGSNGDSLRVYFNADEWTYSPPTGFKALTSANLTKPDHDPREWFNAVGWAGNSGTQSIIGAGFQPSVVWAKKRNGSENHEFQDAVRGAGNRLATNTTDAETTLPAVTSFDVDGFSVGNAGTTNESGFNYIGWLWRANGSGVTNTDGTITSTVSVAEPGHFSIVGYTGTGVTSTVGHGLPGAPELIVVKERQISGFGYGWRTYSKSIAVTQYLLLDGTSAAAAFGDWGGTSPTSSVFTVAGGLSPETVNRSGGPYIAYSFRSVPGICKVGSYTGNGSADGPVIDCGFRPRWVMVKRTNSTGSWWIWDTVRDTFNAADNKLQANTANAEDTAGEEIDILSNGFKLRNTLAELNASGGTYLFLAMADLPFANTDTSIPLAF